MYVYLVYIFGQFDFDLVLIVIGVVFFLQGTQCRIFGIRACYAFGGRLSHLIDMHTYSIGACIVAGHVVDVEEGILGIGKAHHGTADVCIAIHDSFRKMSIFIPINKMISLASRM